MSAPLAPTSREEDANAASAKDGEDPPGREVVVGVDGTEVGLGAVRWAAQEAARRSAPLRILHAAPYLGHPAATGGPPPELPRARGITAVAYTVARHTEPGVQSSTEVVPGDPVTALLRAAAAGQLVVLGSSTTGAADEMVLATMAAKVAARSPAPVVIVPRRRGAEPEGRPAVAVLGVGDRADDEAVALFAAATAQRSGVPLSVLQTRSSGRTVPASWVDDLDEWAQRFPDLTVQHSELPAARANQVLRATCPSPLIMISAGHGTLLHRSLDGPHLWLLRHCTSPMALIPPTDRHARGEAAPPG
ncbi:universal stress protein [Blastococcus sp. CT_GayMR16]|uniref:universal stress protein n=1 Tax=Blastococcus sp. CT_GayMR16 TaxID=2559607 RepID=UPI0010739581|nr:universal stress protein [Blastococcus sp. CT_GayMR16]TFV90600.1 universal stress protein [Blastococcus sp. CT_GayMR16]